MEREPQDWRLRQPRRTVTLAGTAQWEDGSCARVLVSNLSYDGCELWTDHDLSNGETVTLAIPTKGRLEGQVRWVRDGRAGVRFLAAGAPAVDMRRARLGL